MLKLKNVSKIYNNQKVLDNISLDLREKELVIILGESGSGKSTLLNIISAIEKPDSGDIIFGTENLIKINNKKLDYYRNNYIDYIFQSYNLINYLNILDNIILSSKIKKNKIKDNDIKEVLNKLKIDKVAKNDILTLSGGETQRGAIARTLLNDSKILLCDEPTGAVDSKNSLNIMNILKEISKEKLVIVVTHNESLAKKFAKRIIKIKDGKIIKDTDPYISNSKLKVNLKRNKLSYISTLNMSMKNMKFKKMRTFLTMLAFSIGLISLSIVLSISSGFNKEIEKFEKETLFNYPLIISKENISIDNIFNIDNNNYKENYINITDNAYTVTNNIDEALIKKIDKLDKNNIEGISYIKNIDQSINEYLIDNPGKNFFNLLKGSYPINKTEVMLMISDKNSINQTLANYLDIESIKFDEIINKKVKINNKTFIITGLVKSNNEFYKESYGIIYNKEAFNEEITDVLIFPNSYESKLIIKEKLNDYDIIDESSSVINVVQNFVKGVSYILMAFSIISLIVSIIMIAVISYISVIERTREIGILKSIGANSKDIKRLFLSENIIIGLLSSLLTIKIVTELQNVINNFVYKKIAINNIVDFNFSIITFIILVSISLSYLSGLIPARIASRKKVIDILNSSR